MDDFSRLADALRGLSKPVKLILKDAVSIVANDFKERESPIFRVAKLGSPAKGLIYYLDENEEEILFVYHHDGKNFCVLLKQNMDFPSANRKQLAENGCSFLFDSTDHERPTAWGFFKDIDITKDDVLCRYDAMMKDAADKVTVLTFECTEIPNNETRGSGLLASFVIYGASNEAAQASKDGQYVVLFELGHNESEDGGLIRLYQGREIPIFEIEAE